MPLAIIVSLVFEIARPCCTAAVELTEEPPSKDMRLASMQYLSNSPSALAT